MKRLISVIIATCNRCEDLNKVLESLSKQIGDGSFSCEIIVVDNNSTDSTKEAVIAYQDKFKQISSDDLVFELRYLFEPAQGKTRAINKGIREAQGSIIAFTDDDAIPDPKWLRSIVRCFEDNGCDGVGGRVLPIYPENTPPWIKDNHDLISGPIVMYDRGEECKKYQRSMYEFFGANYAFKRVIFDECGFFREDIGPGAGTYGDDTEFVCRLEKMGKDLRYCGEALVWHPSDITRMNLRYIGRWNFQLGRYRFIVVDEGKLNRDLIYYFGIPRCLIREIIGDGLFLMTQIFHRRGFLKGWIKLFIKLGKASEMRRRYQCEKLA